MAEFYHVYLIPFINYLVATLVLLIIATKPRPAHISNHVCITAYECDVHIRDVMTIYMHVSPEKDMERGTLQRISIWMTSY